jgi:hypothetical protein
MDREKLKDKRRELQKSLKLKQQRGRVASQIAHLEKLGHSFTVYYKSENLNWIDSNVRVRKRDGYNGIYGDFQLDVNDSNAVSSLKIKEEEIDSYKFTEPFLSIIPTNNSLIVCYQGGDPELEISQKAFLSKPTIFFSSPETWVITTDKKYVIEYMWGQGVIRFIELQKSNPILVKKIIIEY